MKMNKTVLAVAIAGIAAAPMMASATTTLSGVVVVQFQGSDSEADFTNANGEDGFEAGEARIGVDDVLFGIAASQALNSGLTGYGSLRLDLNGFSDQAAGDQSVVDADGNEIGTTAGGAGGKQAAAFDSVYVGVKGGFGDLRFGEVANPGEYGQISDMIDDVGVSINQGIGYVGSFGGATVGASFSPAPNQDVFGVGAKFAWNGLALGVGMQNLDESTNISASVGFSYAGASIALGMGQTEDGFTAADGAVDDETGIHAKVGYSIAGVSLGLTFESLTEAEDSQVRLDAGYALGGGMSINARVNSFSGGDASGAEDSSDWRIQLGKTF